MCISLVWRKQESFNLTHVVNEILQAFITVEQSFWVQWHHSYFVYLQLSMVFYISKENIKNLKSRSWNVSQIDLSPPVMVRKPPAWITLRCLCRAGYKNSIIQVTVKSLYPCFDRYFLWCTVQFPRDPIIPVILVVITWTFILAL